MKLSTLKYLESKYPHRSRQELKYIVNTHLVSIFARISKNETVDLTVPKFGTIHTHRNSKNKSYKKILVRHVRWYKNKTDFSDKTLLF